MKKISLKSSSCYHRCTIWIGFFVLLFVAAIQAKEFGPYHGEFKSGDIYGITAQLNDEEILNNPLFSRLRSGYPLFQRPSPRKLIFSNIL